MSDPEIQRVPAHLHEAECTNSWCSFAVLSEFNRAKMNGVVSAAPCHVCATVAQHGQSVLPIGHLFVRFVGQMMHKVPSQGGQAGWQGKLTSRGGYFMRCEYVCFSRFDSPPPAGRQMDLSYVVAVSTTAACCYKLTS